MNLNVRDYKLFKLKKKEKKITNNLRPLGQYLMVCHMSNWCLRREKKEWGRKI